MHRLGVITSWHRGLLLAGRIFSRLPIGILVLSFYLACWL